MEKNFILPSLFEEVTLSYYMSRWNFKNETHIFENYFSLQEQKIVLDY